LATIIQRQKVDATFDLKIESEEVQVRKAKAFKLTMNAMQRKPKKCLFKRYTDTGIKLDMLRRLADGSA
jgi:hypothetical protein